MKAVNDLLASEVGNTMIFVLLRYRAVAHKQDTLLGEGTSEHGFPMGWLPSLDSLMHSTWVDAAWLDTQIKAKEEINQRMKLWKCSEEADDKMETGAGLWPWLALEAAYTRVIPGQIYLSTGAGYLPPSVC